MSDLDLVVWSLTPNWATPVVERLEWKTDVMSSVIGTEQRRKVRLSPRRYFEYKINPTGRARSFFDQLSHRVGDDKVLLPLWHDKAKLSADVSAAGTRLDFATTYREFEAGGIAIIYQDAFNYEVAEIDAVDANGLDLAAGLSNDWPKYTLVYPVRTAYLNPTVRALNMTSTVGGATLDFMVEGPNDYATGAEPLDLYNGYPVVTLEPNRLDDLEVQYNRFLAEFDSGTGKVRRYDEGARAFATQFYNWQAVGLQQHHELRQTLYRLQGRLNPIWMPTFNRDVTLSGALGSADTDLDIEDIGYTLLGGLALGRNHLIMKDDDRVDHYMEIEDVGASPGSGQERLVLSAAAGLDAPVGRSGSFLDLVRMEQDIVEITHHTDSQGAMEVSAAFRSFRDLRVPATLLLDPIPDAVMSNTSCGTRETPSLCDPVVVDFALRLFICCQPAPGGSWPPLRGLKVRVNDGSTAGWEDIIEPGPSSGSEACSMITLTDSKWLAPVSVEFFIQYYRGQNPSSENIHVVGYQRPGDVAPTFFGGSFTVYTSYPNFVSFAVPGA